MGGGRGGVGRGYAPSVQTKGAHLELPLGGGESDRGFAPPEAPSEAPPPSAGVVHCPQAPRDRVVRACGSRASEMTWPHLRPRRHHDETLTRFPRSVAARALCDESPPPLARRIDPPCRVSPPWPHSSEARGARHVSHHVSHHVVHHVLSRGKKKAADTFENGRVTGSITYGESGFDHLLSSAVSRPASLSGRSSSSLALPALSSCCERPQRLFHRPP